MLSAEQLAAAVRGHWGIENQLHWVLGVSFGKDAGTLRKDNAPQNFSLLKKNRSQPDSARYGQQDQGQPAPEVQRRCLG